MKGSSRRPRRSSVDWRDLAACDLPGGELARRERQDQVGPALPEADVLDVRPRGTRRRREVRVEDGELVALVLEEPVLRVGLELEAVRAGGRVGGRRCSARPRRRARRPARRPRSAPRRARAARAPRGSRPGSPPDRLLHRGLRVGSASQNGAERYFQPASARIATTTPSSSSAASLRATWTTAPAETPAKTPSRSSSARRPGDRLGVRDEHLAVELATTSRIGGT